MTANAYVGSTPIVEALRTGAEIVITGRVADPSLVVACWHHFRWSRDRLEPPRRGRGRRTSRRMRRIK
ncbi:MAG: acyclic terpene utilization AtuA family protein [Planctomycetaceae bacterium]